MNRSVSTSVAVDQAAQAPKRQLSLFDSTAIIVGIIIGSGLYKSTPVIASNVPSAAWLIGFWIVGGLFALVGSLCYAELATAYPSDGGDYVYLSRAFGRPMGFLFAWAQLWVIRPGSIGAMAFVFATYAHELIGVGSPAQTVYLYSAAPVVLLTAVNILGVRQGKWTQNLLSTAKVVGLVTMLGVGFWYAAPIDPDAETTRPLASCELNTALILIVFTYGGWNDMAYVAAEVRDPQRNIIRALLLGTGAVIAIYVLANAAFVHALGFLGVGASDAVAADVAALAFGNNGRRAISLLVCISTLGAINGMIFTGARIYYAMGRDHRLFAFVGQWSPTFGTPVVSLMIQAATTLAAVLGFAALGTDAFERTVIFTQPVFWGFLLCSGVSLFMLRSKEPDVPRPFRVPLYPAIPLIFCAGCVLVLYSTLSYSLKKSSVEALWSIGLMAIGTVLAALSPRPK